MQTIDFGFIGNYRNLLGEDLGPPGVGVSSKRQRVNLCYCASGSDGMLKRHKVYTGSGRMSLRPVRGCCSCYLH